MTAETDAGRGGSTTGTTAGPNGVGSTRHTVLDSPLGALTLVADGEARTGVYFDKHLRGPSAGELGPRRCLSK